MIPRHAPPFGLGGLLPVLLGGGDVALSAFEQFCAREFGVRETVLLPSARSGILWTLQALSPAIEAVIGPVFTCAVVHQAMQLSGLPVRLVDSEPNGYLMASNDLLRAADRPCAAVLCESYGLRYAADFAVPEDGGAPIARIWDMAMCVPRPDDLRRLAGKDVAVISFGLGKCLYAGWGGLLMTQDAELAVRVRELLARSIAQPTRTDRWRHAADVFVRTAAHNRLLYGCGRTLADWRHRRNNRGEVADPGAVTKNSSAAATNGDKRPARLPREWSEPMTRLNRKLAFGNLVQAGASSELRRRQAEECYRRLEPLGVVRGFNAESLPQSHFPIGVIPTLRAELRRRLARGGIDTATYFPFPGNLERASYPNAARAADEVVLMPLGRCVREGEIAEVARQVAAALEGSAARDMKRLLDIIVSLAAVVLLAPVFLLAACAVKLSSRGPVLFRQERMGRGGRPFFIFKFRTMRQDAPRIGPQITVGRDPRITSVGGVLRKTKLDELPQLFNVLRGDMSLVGPRPEVRRYVEMFAKDYEEILSVRPGITDLASIKYRDESALLGSAADPEEEYVGRILPEKIRLAKDYVRRSSLGLDLTILAKTALVIFRLPAHAAPESS